MEHQDTTPSVINGYEPHSGIRTAAGVLASLFWMGLPVGLCELWRGGGDAKIGLYGLLCALIALVLSVVSIRGTLKQ